MRLVSTLLSSRAMVPPVRMERVEISWGAMPRASPMAVADLRKAAVMVVEVMLDHVPLW